jgi:FG-GAP repeat
MPRALLLLVLLTAALAAPAPAARAAPASRPEWGRPATAGPAGSRERRSPPTGALAARAPTATRPAAGGVAARGDFDGDGFGDLAVGVPGEDVGGTLDAGALNVLYGSAGGLAGTGAQLLWQGHGAPDAAGADDLFGVALAAGDFDGDGFDDLAVGVLSEDLGAKRDAGAVDVLRGSPSGLVAAGARQWSQDSPGVPGLAEAGDAFGSSLAAGDFDGDGIARPRHRRPRRVGRRRRPGRRGERAARQPVDRAERGRGAAVDAGEHGRDRHGGGRGLLRRGRGGR